MDTRPITTASGIGRRDVLVAGAGAALALAVLTEDTEAAAAAKSGWRYCTKCRGLFAGKGTESVGVCPARGAHKPLAGYNYLLLSGLSDDDPGLVKNWYRCEKCRGLFADDAGDTGDCPKGVAHTRIGSSFSLWRGT